MTRYPSIGFHGRPCILLGKMEQLVPGGWGGGGGEVIPYMGYIGICGPKGYGFSAALVINRVSILAILPPFW